MPTTPPRKRLDEALAELRKARQELEAILAERGSIGLDFNSTQSLRHGFAAAIEADRLDRLEARAEKEAEPTNAQKFAEVFEQAWRNSRRSTTDTPDEN